MQISKRGFFQIVIVAVLSVIFYSDKLHEFPRHIHAWTMTDHLAMAEMFRENGFDFFHPATYNLSTREGITPTDFPLSHYLSAILAEVTGLSTVFSYRMINLLFGWLGLLFLYKAARKLNSGTWAAFAIVLTIFSLPVYTYYLASPMPSVFALSCAFIGFYFFVNRLVSGSSSSLVMAILFFSLSALIRLPLTAVTLAVILVNIWRKRYRESARYALGLTPVAAYFAFNKYLGAQYGSQFLGKLLPAESFNQLWNIIIHLHSHPVFTLWHLLLLGLLTGLCLAALTSLSKKPLWSMRHQKGAIADVLALSIISLAGGLAYFLLMAKQFYWHDYYFIDAFYFGLAILFFSLVLIAMRYFHRPKTLVVTVFLLLGPMLYNAYRINEGRYGPTIGGGVKMAYNAFRGSAQFLDSLGISRDAKMLVIDAYTTNTPLLLMERKGWTVLTTSHEDMNDGLSNHPDYIVCPDTTFFRDVYFNDPEIIRKLEKVRGNGKITVYKRSQNDSITAFNGKAISYIDNFSDTSTRMEQALFNEKIYTSPPSSLQIDAAKMYVTFRQNLSLFDPAKPVETRVVANFYFFEERTEINLVASLGDYYAPHYPRTSPENIEKWHVRPFRYSFPAGFDPEEAEAVIYFYNPNKSRLLVDDLRILFYQDD
jgi:hypothetical protein